MFCVKCGSQLPDDVKFCSECGNVLSGVSDMRKESTKLVPAKCTSCGANLEVDADLKAAICPFCDSAYIVEQAIHNYNITLNGSMNIGSAVINVMQDNADNLLARAEEFRKNQEYDKAIEYYNRVLDIDINNKKARDGLELIKNQNESTQKAKELFENKEYTKLLELCDSILATHPEDEEALRYKKDVNECMEEHVYCTVCARKETKSIFGMGLLKLKANKLIWAETKNLFVPIWVEKQCMELDKITEVKQASRPLPTISFKYNGEERFFGIYGMDVSLFIRLITDAKNDIYPPIGCSSYGEKTYYTVPVTMTENGLSETGKLIIKNGTLLFQGDKGGEQRNYKMSSIEIVSKSAVGITLKIEGRTINIVPVLVNEVGYEYKVQAMIENAINGHYYPTTI